VGGVRGAPPTPAGTSMSSDNPSRIRIGANVAQANLLRQTEPVYPPLAKQARVQGAVILEIVIGADGSVKETHVISGHPLLEQAAVDAVQTWAYKPTVLNGQPSETVTTVTVNFALPQ